MKDILLLICGGLISWFVSHLYYRRQLTEAKQAEQKIRNNFDHLAHMLRSAGLDIRKLMDAVSTGRDELVEEAIDAFLPLLDAEFRKVRLRSMFGLHYGGRITREDLLKAYRAAKWGEEQKRH